jgi:hypothetical protein
MVWQFNPVHSLAPLLFCPSVQRKEPVERKKYHANYPSECLLEIIPDDGEYVPLKRRSTIILHGSTSQKTNLNIILAAVRTWNLTQKYKYMFNHMYFSLK